MFSAFNTSPPAIKNACWSRVIYIHLINPEGRSFRQGKFHADCHGASGSLEIPEDLLTGNYYLCAYTKWMRNFSPDRYSYVPVKIINPYSEELERSMVIDSAGTGDLANDTVIPASDNSPIRFLECGIDKTTYHGGEQVQLNHVNPLDA